jgi:hypothetical protein
MAPTARWGDDSRRNERIPDMHTFEMCISGIRVFVVP